MQTFKGILFFLFFFSGIIIPSQPQQKIEDEDLQPRLKEISQLEDYPNYIHQGKT